MRSCMAVSVLRPAWRPAEHKAVVIVQIPGVLHLVEQGQRHGFDPRRVLGIDAVAQRHGRDRGVARVAVLTASQHVVKDAFAHRGLTACAMRSIVWARAIPEGRGWRHALRGLAYGLLGILMPGMSGRYGRRVQALAAQREAA